MNQPQSRHYTEQEFFEYLEQHEGRFELWNGVIYDMNRPSIIHDDIAEKLFELLNARLKPECKAHLNRGVYPPNCAEGFRIPDLVVICGERRSVNREGNDLFVNPIILVEVVSPSTKLVDYEWKQKEYKSFPSLHHYFIVEPNKPQITVWSRQGEFWRRVEFKGLNTVIDIENPTLNLNLNEIYS